MSKKNKGGGFSNLASRKFADASKVPRLSQFEIKNILESDMTTMIDQVVRNRAGEKDAKYPQYITNAFANISTALMFYQYIKEHVKTNKRKHRIDMKKTDLSFEQIDALRVIIAEALAASLRGEFQSEAPDYKDRNDYLTKSFRLLDPRRYRMTKALGFDNKISREKLIISIFRSPQYEIRHVASAFDKSNLSTKKKVKLLKKLYLMTDEEYELKVRRDERLRLDLNPNYVPGKYARFADAIGWAFTIESANSDFTEMCINFVSKQSKEDRMIYMMRFAEAFKVRKTSNFLLKTGTFYKDHKKIFKKLRKMDIGYKKAQESLRGTSKNGKEKDKPKKEKKEFLGGFPGNAK